VGKFPFQSLTRSDPAPEKWNAGPGFLAKTFTPSLEMPTEFLQLFKSGSHVLARGNRANVELARRWTVRAGALLNLREEELGRERDCAGLRHFETVTHKLSTFENGVYCSRKLFSIGLQQISGSKAECALHDFEIWLLTQE